MALNLVLMGPPGAGKGTQAERFARDHGIPKISTGDILREAVQDGTPLGKKVSAAMNRGELISDDVIIDIVKDRLSRPDAARGFVLDGFPRTVPQADALDALLAGRGPLIIVEIQVPDDVLVSRVRNRRICQDCGRTVSAFGDDPAHVERCETCGGKLVSRADDDEKVVRDRLKVYWRDTQPMITHYKRRPTYRTVFGDQPPERVRESIVTAVASALGRPPGDVNRGENRPGPNA